LPGGALRYLRVLWAQQVDDNFHARFDAAQRSYQYLLVNRPVSPAIMLGKVGWFHSPLDEKAMQKATVYLVGEHDFSAFRAAECQAKSPVKHMHRAEVTRIGDHLLFEFRANAFLHHQVRNMVGALIYVGKGKYKPEYMAQLLESRDRKQSPPTFSPCGLSLTGVKYDAKWGLPDTQRSLTLP
jgi:tRNA pseudouridine38-40 synthase